MRRTLLAVAAAALTLAGGVSAGTVTPHNQLLAWPDGTSFTQFGGNAAIVIDTGRIANLLFCPAGIPDFIFPFADVYVVPAGTVESGDMLVDAGGVGPNHVSGASDGAIVDELIGTTVSSAKEHTSGRIRPGTYAVVYDECQDGMFDADDAIFDPAFRVSIEANVPPLPAAVADYKAHAGEGHEALESLLSTVKKVRFIEEHKGELECAQSAIEGGAALADCLFGLALDKAEDAFKEHLTRLVGLVDPLDSAETYVENTLKSYAAIAADPPDPGFDQPSLLAAVQRLAAETEDPLLGAVVDMGNAAGEEDAIADALLHGLERYQGAASAGDGDAALLHARELRGYAALLADQLAASNTALAALSAAAGDPELDGEAAPWEAMRSELAAHGFPLASFRALRNAGFSDAEIADFRAELAGVALADGAGIALRAAISTLEARNASAIDSLHALAAAMKAIAEQLEADAGVADDAPVAAAGGPYSGAAGSPIALDGSASAGRAGHAIASYEWDLDGDGAFDDATGATPAFTPAEPFDGTVGLKVTDDAGGTGVAYAHVSVSPAGVPPSLASFAPASLRPTVLAGGTLAFQAVPAASFALRWTLDGVPVATGTSFVYAPGAADVGVHLLHAAGTTAGGSTGVEWLVRVHAADADGDLWNANVDCDDSDPAVHPKAHEVLGNGKDDDCDPATSDEGSAPTAFFDPSSGGRNVALLEAGTTVISFSSQNDANHSPQAMLNFDADEFFPWATRTGETANAFVKFELAGGKTYLIDRIRIMPRPVVSVSERVKDFEIAVSTTTTEDAAFTIVLRATASDDGSLQEFALPRPALARYVLYRALNNRGSTCCISTQQLKVLTGQEGDAAVTFENLSTDPDDDIVFYDWHFGDGGGSSERSPSHVYLAPGSYDVTLTVTDRFGHSDTFSLVQRVLAVPTAGFALDPSAPREGQTVHLTDASSSPDASGFVRHVWSFGDGTPAAAKGGAAIDHRFAGTGPFLVTEQVTDTNERTATAQRVVTVANEPPTVDAGPDRSTLTDIPLRLAAAIADPGLPDDSFRCSWDFGDGGSAGDCRTEHRYALPAGVAERAFTATLTATDRDGGTGTDSVHVTVRRRPVCETHGTGRATATTSGDLFYTRNTAGVNVRKVTFAYDGKQFTLGSPVDIAAVDRADGLVFAPDGDLVVGGYEHGLHKVNPVTGAVTTQGAGGRVSLHLAVDPSGAKVWSGGEIGFDAAELIEYPLDPFGPGTPRPVAGDDAQITQLAFDACGNGFYTSSLAGQGGGNFGVIDLQAFTTYRAVTDFDAVHGITFDPFTGDVFVYGGGRVAQVDPRTLRVVSERVFPGMIFDQGAADGKGHLFVASNTGHLLFVDYGATGRVGDPANFTSLEFVDAQLDDVAPLSGLGSRPNTPPVAHDGAVITDQGKPVAVHLSADDGENDPLTFSVVDAPAHGTLAGAAPDLTYAPAHGFAGTDSFTFRANDGSEDSNVATVTIEVVATNHAPVARDASIETREDTPVDAVLHADDDDGDSLSFEVLAQPAHGTLGGVAPALTYTPARDYFGPDSFTFRAFDGQAESAAATISIRVTPVNDAPAVSLRAAGPVDEGAAPITLSADAADPEGDALTFTWSTDAGAIVPAGATARFSADDGPASATVVVVASDGALSASDRTHVEIRNVPPAVDAGPDGAGYWGLPLSFHGAVADPSEADTRAGLDPVWSFGAVSVRGVDATHTLDMPGSFVARLDATDKDGGRGSDEASVTIGKRPTSLVYTGPASSAFGFTTLSARLEDTVDGATSQLAGRVVTFTVGGRSYAATTDVAGLAVARTAPLQLAPGAYAVAVSFAEDALYLGSGAQGAVRVENSAGKVTAGVLQPASGGRGGFNVQSDGGAVKGELQFHVGALDFHAHAFTALGISADETRAWFAGAGDDGTPFLAEAVDLGEPGTSDRFSLWIGGVLRTGGGLRGGNVQIHR